MEVHFLFILDLMNSSKESVYFQTPVLESMYRTLPKWSIAAFIAT